MAADVNIFASHHKVRTITVIITLSQGHNPLWTGDWPLVTTGDAGVVRVRMSGALGPGVWASFPGRAGPDNRLLCSGPGSGLSSQSDGHLGHQHSPSKFLPREKMVTSLPS